jgi:hypothetical protein
MKGFLLAMGDEARFIPGVLSGSQRGYRVGFIKPVYFDFDQYVRDPGYMMKVTQFYISVITCLMRKGTVDLLAFLKKNDIDDQSTLGVLPLIGLICTDPDIWLPHIVVRADRMLPHDRIKLDVATDRLHSLEGRVVVIITDHVSSGDELYQAILDVKAYGASVSDAVAFSVWKDLFDIKYGPEIARLGVQFHYLHELREHETEGKVWAELVPNLQEIEKIDQTIDSVAV